MLLAETILILKGMSKIWMQRGNKGGKTVSLNPFRIEDTPENRGFLRRWLKAITMVDDPKSEEEIGRAVTTAFDYLLPEERKLSNLHKSCFSATGHMRRELYRWVDPKQYGAVFNATNDGLDLSRRFTAFDFTYIFEDETLAPGHYQLYYEQNPKCYGPNG